MSMATSQTQDSGASREVGSRDALSYVSLLILVLGAIVVMAPFVWLILTSLKPEREIFRQNPIPSQLYFGNYVEVFNLVPFLTYIRNSLFVAGLSTLGTILSASLCGYGFARLRFWGRDPLFIFVLSTLMLPSVVTLVSVFIIWRNLNQIDTFWPLIVPHWLGGGAFNIFLMRQFFRTIPGELEESARIDGAGALLIWWKIMLPLAKPAVTTVAIFSFMASWNDFVGPLIYLSNENLFTLPLGLNKFVGERSAEWGALMAASTMMTLPMIVLFFVAQRYFVQGIVLTGMKA